MPTLLCNRKGFVIHQERTPNGNLFITQPNVRHADVFGNFDLADQYIKESALPHGHFAVLEPYYEGKPNAHSDIIVIAGRYGFIIDRGLKRDYDELLDASVVRTTPDIRKASVFKSFRHAEEFMKTTLWKNDYYAILTPVFCNG